MQKIIDEFDDEKQNIFLNKLKSAECLKDVYSSIYELLEFYTNINGDYISSLTSTEAKRALSVLSILKEFNEVFNDSLPCQQSESEKLPIDEENLKALFNKNVFIILVAILLTAVLGLVAGNIGLIIGLLAIGCYIKIVMDWLENRLVLTLTIKHQQKSKLIINTDNIITKIFQIFQKIDNFVLQNSTTQNVTKKYEPHLADFPEILEFIQHLSGHTYMGMSPILDFKLSQELPALLARHGIEVHKLLPETLNENLNTDIYTMYDIQSIQGCTQPFVEYPALMKQGNLFRRGKICLPQR